MAQWYYPPQGIRKLCEQAALRHGYTVFGVLNGKECRSGPDALHTYNKDGRSSSCKGDAGDYDAYSVFMFEDEKAPPLAPVAIVTPPVGGTVPGGYSFTLTCGITGYPESEVVWTKDGLDLPDDPNFRVSNQDR